MKAVSLELSCVKVDAGRRRILDVESLRIGSGEFVALVGTNGAGKSTLMKVCCGLVKPDSGEVFFDGATLNKISGWAQSNLRKKIGYIPQAAEYNSELPFTVKEVVAMGLAAKRQLLGGLRKEDNERVDHWIERVGLADRRGQTFRSLSGGQQQKVLIARAMAAEPGILMFDEPYSSLDFSWKYQITEMIDELYRENQVTVLMVCHEVNLLPKSCDRVVLLHQGKVVCDGDKKKVLSSDEIMDAYQCKIETVQIGGRDYVINEGL